MYQLVTVITWITVDSCVCSLYNSLFEPNYVDIMLLVIRNYFLLLPFTCGAAHASISRRMI